MEFFKMICSMRELLTVVLFEMFIVMVAMGWDFASGYYKAKLRGEERNSYGMRRTVSKFILYAGSVCIACGIDSVCYVCRFWEFIHLPFLTNVPVVSSIVTVFILITEVRSIWEKADAKQRRQASKTADMIGKVVTQKVLEDALTNALSNYNPQIQISAESETKRSIFREKDKTKRSKKESAQHSKSRNKSFVMTSVSAL